MLKTIIISIVVIAILVLSGTLVVIQIKNYLTNTAIEQIENVKEFILEKVDDLQIEEKIDSLVETVEEIEIADKVVSVKNYLTKLME